MAKQPTVIHKLYGGEVEIEFRENPYHTYKLLSTGQKLLSVTSITGIIDFPKDVAMRWAIGLAKDRLAGYLAEREDLIDKKELETVISEALALYCSKREEAASNGLLVHAWVESYARAKMEDSPMPSIGEDLSDQVIAGINGFLDFVNSRNVKFLEVERLVYSKTYDYCGLFDALVEIDGKKYVVDWKTSKAIYPGMLAQVAAYRHAFQEETGESVDTLIVRFDKDTGEFEYKDISSSYEDDLAMFIALVTTKKRIKEIEKSLA